MELKDYLTIGVAVLAIVVSVIALVVSTRKKDTEDERTLRSLLNDAISKIHTARIDQAKYKSEHVENPQDFSVEAVNGLYNYQINSLTRLAVYITEKIPNLVTDVEFATIADAFAWVGDHQKGSQYWQAAVDTSRDKYYEIVNRRSYANYLFTNGNVGAGREQYKKALDLWPIGNDDFSKQTTGYTYRMWAVNERQAGNHRSANEYFDKAVEAYTAITVEGYKAYALNDLNWVRRMPSSSIPEARPGEPPTSPSPIADVNKLAEVAVPPSGSGR